MEPNTYFEIITKSKALLTDRNTYYVLFMAVLGFLLYKSDMKVTELEAEKKSSDSLHATSIAAMQNKIDGRNCVEEFKIWQAALMSDLDHRKETEARELQQEKKRTEELARTYELLKNPK